MKKLWEKERIDKWIEEEDYFHDIDEDSRPLLYKLAYVIQEEYLAEIEYREKNLHEDDQRYSD